MNTLFRILALSSLCVGASGQGLEAVLAKMDESAAGFRGMTAKLRRVVHTAVINDNSEESGTVMMLRLKPRDLRMRIDFTEPDPKSVAFQDRKAEIYYPKIETVQEYDLGKHRALVDQFLLLGFGTGGKEMARNYSVKLAGEEMAAGVRTWRLELTPRSAQVKEHLKSVELWITQAGGYPVQQKFFEPSGNYTLIQYSEVKWNPELTASSLNLNLPKKVKREYPQR